MDGAHPSRASPGEAQRTGRDFCPQELRAGRRPDNSQCEPGPGLTLGGQREHREDQAPGAGASAGASVCKGQDGTGEHTYCVVGPLAVSPKGPLAFPLGLPGEETSPTQLRGAGGAGQDIPDVPAGPARIRGRATPHGEAVSWPPWSPLWGSFPAPSGPTEETAGCWVTSGKVLSLSALHRRTWAIKSTSHVLYKGSPGRGTTRVGVSGYPAPSSLPAPTSRKWKCREGGGREGGGRPRQCHTDLSIFCSQQKSHINKEKKNQKRFLSMAWQSEDFRA